MVNDVKTCRVCKVIKPITDFGKRSVKKDGISCTCKKCNIQAFKSWRLLNKEKVNLSKKIWVERNLEKRREIARKSAKRNRYKNVIWKKNNPGIVKLSNQKYVKNNPNKVNLLTAKRRARLLNATPSWLSQEHWTEIQEYYTLAKELEWLCHNDTLEVDHIVPLQGKNVSGLHVPWNLQILPSRVNLSKGNKHD